MQKFKFFNVMADESDVEIRINGEIVSDDEQEFNEYFGVTNTTAPSRFREFLSNNKGKPITIYIDSPGGDLIAASSIYTALKEFKGNITAKIEGMCASAATIIAMAADKVIMSPTALFMIHQAMVSAYGNKEQMKAATRMLEEVDEAIVTTYQIKTGLSREKLNSLMQKESWMNAKTAKEYGFIDEIMGEDKLLPDELINSIIESRKTVYNIYKRKEDMKDEEKIKEEEKRKEELEIENKKIRTIYDFNARRWR